MRVPVRLLITMLTIVGALAPLLILLTGFWSSTRHYTTSRLLVTSFADASSTKKESSKLQQVENMVTFRSPDWWRRHLESTCGKLGHTGNMNLSLSLLDRIIVNDKYKIMYCPIPKVASTTWRRIFILLSGHASMDHLTSMLPDDVHHKYSKYLKHLSDYTQEEISYRIENYFKFLFVREPYERILSAYRNKFLSSTNSSKYFKKKFAKKIINKYRPNPPADNEGEGLQFPEFVDYLLDKEKKIPMNEHWDRFYHICAPCQMKYDFVGKLESIETDFDFLLSHIIKDFSVRLPSRSDLKYTYNQTNVFIKEFYSQLSRRDVIKMYQMYKKDFLLFNYSMPSQILSILSGNKLPTFTSSYSNNNLYH
ncbi:Carbohydrate sulfotransferase 11 [Bulinus truncatus]|nr:Carbohydrate sulfotransferase 11 [Bulinus truncatus]